MTVKENSSAYAGISISENNVTLPILQEELRVGIKTVDTGKGIRVHKSVTEKPATVEETLFHEEWDIQHVPVNAIISLDEVPVTRYEGHILIVPIMEEVLVVEKRLRLKEEIHITKRMREEHHFETVLLKSEEISIEHFDEASEMERK